MNIVFGLTSAAWNALSIEDRATLLAIHQRATTQQQIDYEFYAAAKQQTSIYAYRGA